MRGLIMVAPIMVLFWITVQVLSHLALPHLQHLLVLRRMFGMRINFSKLSKSHHKTQKYWMLAVDATLKAKALESARGARAKRVRQKLNTMIPSRKKLGIATVEHQIHKDGMHWAAVQMDGVQAINCSQISLE
jgi:hypothetical protein